MTNQSKRDILEEILTRLAILQAKVDYLVGRTPVEQSPTILDNLSTNIGYTGCPKCFTVGCGGDCYWNGHCWIYRHTSLGSISDFYNKSDKCLWENIPAEDRMKPMGLSCSCRKCSAYC